LGEEGDKTGKVEQSWGRRGGKRHKSRLPMRGGGSNAQCKDTVRLQADVLTPSGGERERLHHQAANGYVYTIRLQTRSE
jgi:hypothetical protein